MADPLRIEQIIVNLLRNALDAVRGRDDKRIKILLVAGRDDPARRSRTTAPGSPTPTSCSSPSTPPRNPARAWASAWPSPRASRPSSAGGSSPATPPTAGRSSSSCCRAAAGTPRPQSETHEREDPRSRSSTTRPTCARASRSGCSSPASSRSCFEAAEPALKVLGPDFAGVVISDIRMPGMDGMALLRRLQSIDPGPAGDPDDRPRRRADGGRGDAHRRLRLRREAVRPRPAGRALPQGRRGARRARSRPGRCAASSPTAA